MALVSLTIASQGAKGGNGNNGSGIPVGSFVITTLQGTLQSASGYNYDVRAFADFPNGGSFDPHGTLSLQRSWQGIDANGNYTAPTPVVIYDKNGHVATDYTGGWPANSPFWKTQGKDMGNYMAGYPGDCTNSTLEVGGYGREIIQLVYTAFATNYLPVVIATQYIQLYPNTPTQDNTAKAVFTSFTSQYGAAWQSGVSYSPANPSATPIPTLPDVVTYPSNGSLLYYSCKPLPVDSVTGNPIPNIGYEPDLPSSSSFWSPVSTPLNIMVGDLPRITITLTDLFPGSTISVKIYPTLTPTASHVLATITDPRPNPVGFWRTLSTQELSTATAACGIDQSKITAYMTYIAACARAVPPVTPDPATVNTFLQNYTIEVDQQLPAVYTAPCDGSTNNLVTTFSFSVLSGFVTNAQLGILK